MRCAKDLAADSHAFVATASIAVVAPTHGLWNLEGRRRGIGGGTCSRGGATTHSEPRRRIGRIDSKAGIAGGCSTALRLDVGGQEAD